MNVTPQQVYIQLRSTGADELQAQVGAALVDGIESNGDPTVLSGGIGPAAGLFQFEPPTWIANGGGVYSPVAQGASWQEQCLVFIQATNGDYFGDWGPDLGRPYGQAGGPLPGSPVANKIAALTQQGVFGTGGGSTATSTISGLSGNPYAQFSTLYPVATAPPVGFISDVAEGLVVINGTTADTLLGDALVSVALDYSTSQASTVTLTIHDPHRTILNLPEFQQASMLEFGGSDRFQLVSVDKQQSLLTVTFEAWAVAALRQSTGPYTVAPGTIKRTEFARILATESVDGIGFTSPPDAYLYSLDDGYERNALEQLSRGTVDAPLEDSWTALQRLAAEIQWVCFEFRGTIYFGPYSYLTSVAPVLSPVEFQGGIQTMDGTYDVGQPIGNITVSAVAGSWAPPPGACVAITTLGPFNGNWYVADMSRTYLDQPDITITLAQPLPNLPEPAQGGAQAAVGANYAASNVQSTGGSQVAQQAVTFALSKVGDAYSEAQGQRLGPNSYDCSGLVYEAYLNAGVQLSGSTTGGMWPNGAGPSVPPGIGNLLPGDLVFFQPPGGSPADYNGHVAMVVSVNTGAGTVHIVEAASPSQGVITDDFTPTVGAAYGSTLQYAGATRPAP